MSMVQVFPTVQFTNRRISFAAIAMELEILISEMSLKEDQSHPAEKAVRSFLLQFVRQRLLPICEHFTQRLFKPASHRTIALRAARDCVLSVPESSAVGKHNRLVMQAKPLENPVGKDMFVIEGDRACGRSTNEATIPLGNVRNKPANTEEDYAAPPIYHGVVSRCVKQKHLLR